MPQITVTEQGGTGRYISFGDAAALRDLFNNPNGATIIAYVKPGDQAAINYLFCKCDSSGYGMRFTNTTTEQLGCAVYRGGGTSQVSGATSGSYTQGTWQHWQVSHPGNGSLLGAGLNFFIDDSASLTKTLVTDATSPIASDSGLTAMILNRTGLGRHWIGDVAYVAAWNRVLSDIERATVRTNGPLDVPSGLVFCFANGQDYGPNAVAVVDRTAQVAGSTPTNTNLGGGIALAGAAAAVASASAAFAGSDTTLAGNAVAQASASATFNSITIYDTADRGTLDLTGCSVVPNGTTPTINIKNQYSWEENASGARFCFFHVSGVNGLRPVFDVDRSNMQLSDYTGKFKWSYTGERGTWNDFTTTTREATPNVYRSQHADAFTQDAVYVSMANPWRVGYTLPWIQSLESSGLISPAPSGSGSYQFETRSATTDHQGVAIAAQPLFSFKISNGAALAPDGLPKRKLVMVSGMHASEDVGNYALKGAVEFLLSSDPLAIRVLDWFDGYGYPGFAQAGRAGGAQRGDFHAAQKSADVNRAWDGVPALETITKHKAALATDVGSTIHVFLDFHGDHTTTANTSFFEGSAGDPYGAKWDAAIDTHQVTTIVYSSSAEFSTGWIKANKGCPYNLTPECGYLGEWTPASKESFGAANIKAIATLIAQGEWGQVALAGAALGMASAAGALTTDIPLSGAAVATSSASGSMEAQVSLSGAALAQAVSSALLSTGIVMTAAAVAQAAAQGTLITAIQMLGTAQAQAGGSGSLTTSTGGLEGTAQASASAAASLTAEIRLTGAAVAQASASGALAGASIDLAGAAVATAYAGADLTVTIALTAQALASAIASGGLTTQIVLQADATARAAAGASLSGGSGFVIPAAASRIVTSTSRRPSALSTRRR